MYEDCARARESIEFEQYILENDAIGRRFMELFTQKAAEKVKIFILCDKFGSLHLWRSRWVRNLRKAGGAFYFYRPIGWWALLMPWQWFPRTHTKTLLIDSKVAYTGGVCIDQKMQDWRDTQVRFTGSAIAEVREAFDALEAAKGRRVRRFPFHFPQLKDRAFVYLQNLPRLSRHHIYQELIAAIEHAEKYIYIATAYFAPNRRFIQALADACARGVDVKLMLGGTSDVPLADFLCLTYVPSLHRAGVRVYHYEKTILHCKTVVVDGGWATVGSTNMDVISFFHNREANLVIVDKTAVAELTDHFRRDLGECKELTPEEWERIPLWKIVLGWMMRSVKIFFRG
jgi:cardiolipin synthase